MTCGQNHSLKKIQTRRVNENFLLEVITGLFGVEVYDSAIFKSIL